MPIDASIALQGKPLELDSPINQYAKILQLQQGQQQNQLNNLKISEAGRDIKDKNALSQLLNPQHIPKSPMFLDQTPNPVTPVNINDPGTRSKIMSLGKIGQEYLKTADEGAKSQGELIDAAMKRSQSLLEQVQTPEEYIQWHQANHSDPILGSYLTQRGVNPEGTVTKVQDALRKGTFPQLLLDSQLGLEKTRKQHYIERNNGGETFVTAVPEYGTGPAMDVEGSREKVVKSPNAPQTTVNIDNVASKTAAQTFIEEASNTRKTLVDVPQQLDNIEKARLLIPSSKNFMGPGSAPFMTTAKFLNQRLGTNIDMKGLKSAEELKSRVFTGVISLMKKIDPNPSERQQQLLQDALGSMTTDPNALSNVLDVYAETLRGRLNSYNKDVTDAEARGTKFPYRPQIDVPKPAVKVKTTASPKGVTQRVWDAMTKEQRKLWD